jgi:signal transduction histidine kinase
LAFTGDAYTQHEAWAGPTADPISKPPLAERKSMLLVPGRDALGRICAVLKFENIDTSQIESDSLVFLPKANLHLALQLANAATAVIAPISKELEYERAHEQGLVEARQRLTVELHAALQYVAIIANTADRIRQQEGIDDVVRKTASELVAQAQKFNVDVRLSLAGASNDMLVSDGLCAALAGYVLHCGRYSDDQIIDFRSVGKPRRIHPTAEWALFMIARNAIANALKHSHVRDMRQGAIWVRIVFQDDGIVELHVEDNGCGFNPELTHAGFGLKQMRMLADEIDATLTIKNSNSDSTGTRVSVTYDVEAFNAEASA